MQTRTHKDCELLRGWPIKVRPFLADLPHQPILWTVQINLCNSFFIRLGNPNAGKIKVCLFTLV